MREDFLNALYREFIASLWFGENMSYEDIKEFIKKCYGYEPTEEEIKELLTDV